MKIIWLPNALLALTFKTGNGQVWVLDGSLPNYEFQPATPAPNSASDAADCESQCSQEQTCAYWSFRPAVTSPAAPAACTLSDGTAHPVRVGDTSGAAGHSDDIPGLISGVKDPTWPSTACGTGNHPQLANQADWPGATAADSHSAWSTGRQPVGLECWPKGNHANANAFDLYSASGDISVLQSTRLGWDGKCQHLEAVPIPAASSADADWCENDCRGKPFCPSWQMAPQTTPPVGGGTGINSGGCWQGVGDHCNNRAGQAGFTPVGAERYQHGQVLVLRRITDFKVRALHNIFGIDFATQNNQTFAIQACREACYSDLDCNYWQYVQETGCWSEAPSENSNVPNPLTIGDVDSGSALSGVTINSGEFIQHWARPPQCPVIAVTNAAGAGGTEACGAGITFIADGATCAMDCATGYTPSAPTATCANRVLAPVTCNPDACNVGTVTNAAGTGGAEPCGPGVNSIANGNNCTVTCASGFVAHPAAATCAHGTLQSIQCRVQSPCAVVAVTNAAGAGGASPCGTGVTSILNGDECTVQCATGYHPSAATATCTSGTLDPVTCVANLPCSVGTVTNAAGTGGAEPCGTGVSSIADGNNCTVTCANAGFRAVPAIATCNNGVLSPRECRVRSPCTVGAVTNAAGIGGIAPCGTGVTTILNGDECTMQCATGFHPSAATATCTSGTLDPVTCVPNLPCSAGIVTNAAGTGRGSAGTGGNEPCGIGVNSIDDGDNCTVACDIGYRAVPATATCNNGVLAPRECRVRSPCTVVAITNAAGIGGVSPCGAGVTTILNGEQCAMQCAIGFTPSAPAATCTSGTLQPATCVANAVTITPAPPAPPASGTPWLLIGLILLALLIALLVCIFLCFNQDKPKSPKKRAVKPVKKKEPPAPPPPAPTQSRPVAVMMPTYVQAPQMVQAQPHMNTSFVASPAPQMAQAVQITPSMSLQSLQQPLARSPR